MPTACLGPRGMLVSILMPVYNGENYIGPAIESVLAQDYQTWELLVVDDGSTDRSAAIARAVADPRVRYSYKENGGQSSALNLGLRQCRGEYVTTLDADDMLTPNALGDRVSYLARHPEHGAVYSDGFYCDALMSPLLRLSEYRPANHVGDVYGQLVTSCFIGAPATVMIRKDILDCLQIEYDESIIIAQDWDFYLRLAEKVTFGYVDSPAVLYRLHGNNMTLTEPGGRRLQSLLRTKKKVLESSRFGALPSPQKAQFFYSLLVSDLRGRPGDQMTFLECGQFQSLPNRDQSRLLRLVAVENLLTTGEIDVSRRMLELASKLAPRELKARAVALGVRFAPGLARRAVIARRSLLRRARPTPFELALASGQCATGTKV